MRLPRQSLFMRNRLDVALWTLSVLALVGIVALSLGPGPDRADLFPHADKVWHLLAYAGLTGSWLLAAVWRPGRGSGRWPHAASPILWTAVALGTGLELLQRTVDRSADPLDWAANVLGICAAAWTWGWLKRTRS